MPKVSWFVVVSLLSAPALAQPSPAAPPSAPPAAEPLIPSVGTAAPAKPAEAAPPAKPAVEEGDLGVAGLDLTASGQYLLRFRHHEGHDFVGGGVSDTLRHRARLGLEGVWKKTVGVNVQLQDVRLLGEERNTLGDFAADGFDVHQAYARVMPIEGLELRAGRQEIVYENHRLIGNVGWIEQGRSFDAVRFLFDEGILHVDSFYAKVADTAAKLTDSSGNPLFAGDKDLMAGNVHLKVASEFELGVLGIGDRDGGSGLALYTVGAIAQGKTSFGLSYSAEGYFQHGLANQDRSATAWMAGGMVGYQADVVTKPYVRAFAEALSGDTDPNDAADHTFNTLYATGHKFHGEMDFFLAIPADTKKRGLLDVGGVAGLAIVDGLDFWASYHHFRATAARDDGLAVFGNELDVWIGYKPWKVLKLDLCYGLFAPGSIFDAPIEATGGSAGLEHFVYSTVDASF